MITTYKPRLCFAPAGMDGCAYWRMWLPHLHMENSKFVFTEGTPQVNEMAECDVVVAQRLMLQGNIKFLQIIRTHGIRLVYDLDDDLWNLPVTNPAHGQFNDPVIRAGMENCASWADVIVVSTNTLKRQVEKQWWRLRNVASGKPIPVVVIENKVDTDIYKPLFNKHKEKETVVIGWAGSNTHQSDLDVIWPALKSTLARHPNVRLELVGHSPHPMLAPHRSQIRERPWAHISEYAQRMALWDWNVLLAPLENNEFNKSKSPIKMIEAGALELPCLASAVQPYKEFCSYDKDLRWLLCPHSSQWSAKITRLVEDREWRLALGDKMLYNVAKHYNIQSSIKEWEEVALLALTR